MLGVFSVFGILTWRAKSAYRASETARASVDDTPVGGVSVVGKGRLGSAEGACLFLSCLISTRACCSSYRN